MSKNGETQKIFCLKYSKEKKQYYCSEILKGDDTRDCAFTSTRLFNSSGDSQNTEITCLEARKIYNKEN
jgi:hypothetical protein